ncbi:hypothetical protein [Tabrizicola aquatica]|uniref:hypothetical protein n=1 Tax=Tabrizicola aquatica TaxID=909926 RepID=UPI0015E17282|nr:hypothetical protein [Tabrizicola aquatica]
MSDSIPIGPNGILAEVRAVALLELSLSIRSILRHNWGNGWLQRLNTVAKIWDNTTKESRDGSQRKKLILQFTEHGFNCDHNQAMVLLQQLVNKTFLSEFAPKKDELLKLASERIEKRNYLEHNPFLPPTQEEVLEEVNATVSFLEMVGSTSGIEVLRKLSALISSDEKLIITAEKYMNKGADAGSVPKDVAAMLSMMQELLSHAKQAQPGLSKTDKDEIAGLVAEVVQNQLSARPQVVQPAPVLNGRRRSPIPSPAKGVVLFPIVSASSEEESDFGVVKTQVIPSLGEVITFGSTFPEPTRRNAYQRFISEARHREMDGLSAEKSTRASLDPSDFSGNSYALAAAIADKSARYGLSNDFAERHVVATGTLERGGQGAVVEIDDFPQKVRLLVRSAPPGALFIFPKANLDASDAQTRELLNKGNFEWRAIAHVDELQDIFAAVADPVLPGEKTRPRVLTPAGDEVVDTNGDAAQSSAGVAAIRAGRPALAAAVIAGVVLLGGAFAASEWYGASRLDPIQAQASDERLARLAEGASRISKPLDSAPNCRELLAASTALTDVDRDRMLPVHDSAVSASSDCAAALKESEQKWAQLASAASMIAKGEAVPVDQISALRESFGVFALSDASSSDRKTMLASVDAYLGENLTRQGRWEALAEAITAWRSNEVSRLVDDVANTYAALTPEDRSLASQEQKVLMSAGQSALAAQQASDRRLSDLVASSRRLSAEPGAAAVTSANAALGALLPLDHARADAAELDAISAIEAALAAAKFQRLSHSASVFQKTRNRTTARELSAASSELSEEELRKAPTDIAAAISLAVEAQLELVQSLARERRVVDAVRSVDAAESSSSGLASAYGELVAAVEELTSFDEVDSSAALRAAVTRSDRVRRLLSQSDVRIREVMRLAEQSAGYGQSVPPAIGQAFQAARSSLTTLDLERLSEDQRRLLDSVCGISGPLAPGVLAPADRCVNLTQRSQPWVLKPSAPAP